MKKQNKLGRAAAAFVMLAIIGLATGCGTATPTGNTSPIASGSAVASAGGSPTFTAASAPSPAAVVAKAKPPSRWKSVPARSVTPGSGRLSIAAICPSVSAALEERRPSTAVKDEVYDEYGIAAGQRYRYRIDHLVPLELDGSNSIRNLWPQLIGASRAKDRLEDTLHSMVCWEDHAGGRAVCDQNELGPCLSPVCEPADGAERSSRPASDNCARCRAVDANGLLPANQRGELLRARRILP
jgi:hypothetical protein